MIICYNECLFFNSLSNILSSRAWQEEVFFIHLYGWESCKPSTRAVFPRGLCDHWLQNITVVPLNVSDYIWLIEHIKYGIPGKVLVECIFNYVLLTRKMDSYWNYLNNHISTKSNLLNKIFWILKDQARRKEYRL